MTLYCVKFKDGTVVDIEADKYPVEVNTGGIPSGRTLVFERRGETVGTFNAHQVDGYWEKPRDWDGI